MRSEDDKTVVWVVQVVFSSTLDSIVIVVFVVFLFNEW